MQATCFYTINPISLTWAGHLEAAESRGCALASIQSFAESSELENAIKDANISSEHVWLGGRLSAEHTMEGGASFWTWTDGSAWEYEAWMQGEPNNYWGYFGTENRVAVRHVGDESGWDDVGENNLLPGAYKCCEPQEQICQYELSEIQKTWFQHRNAAKGNNCDLASIVTVEDEEAIVSMIKQAHEDYLQLDVTYWTGGINKGTPGQNGESNWLWDDGNIFFYENWMEGEPNNWGSPQFNTEDRLLLRSIYGRQIGWLDGKGTEKNGAVYKCCSDSRPRGEHNRLCWLPQHSYGVAADGACSDAAVVSIISTSTELQCFSSCLALNAKCGGWEFNPYDHECTIKAPMGCTPALALSGTTKQHVISGISGCVDLSSTNLKESAALELPDSDQKLLDCEMPRCTSPQFYGGSWKGDTFMPRDCWYKHFGVEHLVEDCAQDRWIVLNGGSNILSFFAHLVNLFAPIQQFGSPESLINFWELYRYPLIDIVFEPGSLPLENPNAKNELENSGIIHFNLQMFCEMDNTIPCNDFSLAFHGDTKDWQPQYINALESSLSKAPYQKGSTRLTLITSQMWSNSAQVLRLLGGQGATNGWQNADIVYYGQAMIWYTCFVSGWCEMDELGPTRADMFSTYQKDFDGVMEIGQSTCATDRFDCFFATHGYEHAPDSENSGLINILESTVSKFEWAHFVDYNGFLWNSEVLDGHMTPAMHLPAMAMMWNTICDGPERGCPEAIITSDSCWDKCEERGGNRGACRRCPAGSHDDDWTCVNSRHCHAELLETMPWDVVASRPTFYPRNLSQNTPETRCFDEFSIEYFPSDPQDDDKCSRRIWCTSPAIGWVIGIFSILVGILAVYRQFLFNWMKKLKQYATASKTEVASEAEDKNFSREHTAVVKNGVDEEMSPTPEQAPPPPKDHLHSLGAARILASFHIVAGHMAAKGVLRNAYFFGWGFTWVPWFFILSGYVLTHARLNSSKPNQVDGPYNHVAKRMASIFPMYAFGVILSVLVRVAKRSSLPKATVLISQSFLLQAWNPLWTEHALLSQCWFLSCMLVYWVLFRWIYQVARKLTLKTTCIALLGVCFVPWLLIIVPVSTNRIKSDWYRGHAWGQTDEAVDILAIMLKFNPICYLHVFLFGVLLARLRHILKSSSPESRFTNILKCSTHSGATLGYLGLILVFTIESIQPRAWKLSTRLSVLLPLQGLMLLGLSPLPGAFERRDPVAKVFALAPSWIGDVSYCQYILQFATYELFPVKKVDNLSYFLFLLGASMLCYILIHRPAANLWRTHLLKNKDNVSTRYLPSRRIGLLLLIPPTTLALVLGISKGAYRPSRFQSQTSLAYGNTTNHTIATPFVRVGPEVVDLQLNWTSTGKDGNEKVINPSMLFIQDDDGGLRFIRAARIHSVNETITLDNVDAFEGNNVRVEQTLNFESDIAMASEIFSGDLSVPFDGDLSQWGLDGQSTLLPLASANLLSQARGRTPWRNLCEPTPFYNAEDEHLTRKIVDGPEDPKLLQLANNDWGFSFSSFPPASLFPDHVTPEQCKWSVDTNMQMYIATGGDTLSNGGQTAGRRILCGDIGQIEKNWISFMFKGDLHYISTVEPHVVHQVNPADGSCGAQYSSSSNNLRSVNERGMATRGSAAAIPYSKGEYLALMHTHDRAGSYTTLAYTFQAEPPFAIQRISRPLPLQGGSRAFASSLAIQNDKVLVGYGEADLSSRVMVMSTDFLESQFEWCGE